MTGRPMDTAVSTALDASTLYPAWVIRLDILDDPVLVWTGLGPLDFSAGATDPDMDGLVFEGIANIGEIGAVVDAKDGSQSVKLTLAGVDPTQDELKAVVFDNRTWQFRQAWMWVVLLNSSGAVIGEPVRVKTARMDQITVEEDVGKDSTVSVTLESHQAYAGQALNTKYSEQRQVDASDSSQDYVASLANLQPTIGQAKQSSPITPSGYAVSGLPQDQLGN